MDRQLISEWFDYVPVLFWPVLCLEIMKFYLRAWADAKTLGYAPQMIVGVSYTGRIRVRFIEDAPPVSDDWQALIAAHIARCPGEGRDPSLTLSHCVWAVFQNKTPAFAGASILAGLVGSVPAQPLLDTG